MHKDKKIEQEKLQYSLPVVCPELDLVQWQKKAYRSFYFNKPVRRLIRIITIAGCNPLNIAKSGMNLLLKVLS